MDHTLCPFLATPFTGTLGEDDSKDFSLSSWKYEAAVMEKTVIHETGLGGGVSQTECVPHPTKFVLLPDVMTLVFGGL